MNDSRAYVRRRTRTAIGIMLLGAGAASGSMLLAAVGCALLPLRTAATASSRRRRVGARGARRVAPRGGTRAEGSVDGDTPADESLDVAEELSLVAVTEGNRASAVTRAPRPPDSVDVALGDVR